MDSSDEESSMQLSDADPQALLDSLKDMDDLDAELFGGKKSKKTDDLGVVKPKENNQLNSSLSSIKKSTFGEKKRVSFHDDSFLDAKKEEKDDDLDFDLDDPLGDLLSDDDGSFQYEPPKRKVAPIKETLKNEKPKKLKPVEKASVEVEEAMFADADSDVFDALGLDDEKKPSKQLTENDSHSRLDDLLATKPVEKKTEEKPRKTLFDKDGNFLKDSFQAKQVPKASPKPAQQDDVSFGGYQPSSTGGTPGRRQKPISDAKKKDNFFDFLADNGASSETSFDRPQSTPSSKEKSKSVDFLGLGDEVDLDSVLSDKPRPATTPVSRRPRKADSLVKGEDNDSVTSEDPLPAKGKPPRFRSPPLVTPLSPAVSAPVQEPSSKPSTPAKLSQHVSEANILDELESSTPKQVNRTPTRSRNHDDVTITQPRREKIPIRNFDARDIQLPSAGSQPTRQVSSTSNTKIQSLESQLEHMRALLHETQLGFRADLELTQQTYDGRVELLQHSLAEVRNRSERELESIKESYAARLDAVREQSREHAREAAGRDLAEQDEIKRLREFHLKALEETRHDYDLQMTRLKKTHAQEIDTIKNSSQITRNVGETTEKLDSAIQLLQKLAAKYDSAFHVITQQSETMATSSNKMQATIQAQMQAMQRSNAESHTVLQQTATRMEVVASEINRKFEELQYAMQVEQNKLQVAQASLESEKRQMFQQVALEREQSRKAHNEALELQQAFQREAREERDRFARKDEEMRATARALEEARAAESERMSQREVERRNAAEELARERASLAGRSERMSALEARLNAEKSESDRKSDLMRKEERELEERRQVVMKMEKDVKEQQEHHAEKIAESSRALQEAKLIEREHQSRLSDIHAQSQELARQRQLLAEERKLLVHERLDAPRFTQRTTNPGASPIASEQRQQYDVTPVKLSASVTPVVPTADANAVLWKHAADKDRDFLEDEEFFLETLKRSPYHGIKT
uniref:Fas-binding factor 1 homolog n=1 Tax=Phallusia mammillata TaxID=59560 RepID=A0A6F9DD71_9ASCI|nr:fas-binding factor 1 homolog [Phallusia mammillata]